MPCTLARAPLPWFFFLESETPVDICMIHLYMHVMATANDNVLKSHVQVKCQCMQLFTLIYMGCGLGQIHSHFLTGRFWYNLGEPPNARGKPDNTIQDPAGTIREGPVSETNFFDLMGFYLFEIEPLPPRLDRGPKLLSFLGQTKPLLKQPRWQTSIARRYIMYTSC